MSANAVIDWNATTESASRAFGGPPQQQYLQAMAQIAVHDALNAIDPRYETYTTLPAASSNASPDAAIAAAARDVLINQLSRPPETAAKAASRANVEAAYAAALAQIPNGVAKLAGIAAGQSAAAAIITMRLGDGSSTPHLPYTLAPAPGVHQPTPPNLPAPMFAGWALVTPFAMTSPSQFRAAPSAIFNLASSHYARDYNEVKNIGSAIVRAASPDSAESDIARFWPGGGSEWNTNTRIIVDGLDLDRWQHARLLALLNIAQADSAISIFDTKYHYNYWRPVTAIRWANDGNSRTAPDPNWLPFLPTPPYPDYTCNLPANTGAAVGILRSYFGTDHVGFTRSFNAPALALPPPLAPLPAKTITRSYNSLSQAASESGSARIYAGIHFRTGCVLGIRQGEQVASHAFRHYLRPLRGH